MAKGRRRIQGTPTFATMPERRNRRKRSFLGRLKDKYRLSLVNETSFEERMSFRLSRINVILLATVAFLVCAALVTSFIVFTPVKRLIPGYADQKTKLNAYRATMLADSLQGALLVRDLYINNLRNVLSGRLPADSATLFRPIAVPPRPEDLKPGLADSLLRERVRRDEAYSVQEQSGALAEHAGLSGIFFFPPLRGVVTDTFDVKKGHYGVDIVTKADDAVKACLEGTVILSSWTSDGGYVMQVQHGGNLVSVYKHNAVLLREQGDRVKAGEAIAIVGNSGELTTGPHLHFELWHRGEPVDPRAYMVFK
jgi:murein DD-endopeptidase MepM/ murein hydrolase activator NlpD